MESIMHAKKVVDFFSNLVSRVEPEYTFKLVGVEYSKKHGHEVCVMQLTGKNTFPKLTPQEILSNSKSLNGLSPTDASAITALNFLILERMKKQKVLEVDKNGTIVLVDHFGNLKRYSERYISKTRNILTNMHPEDAHDLGYRVGFRDGLSIAEGKKQAKNSLTKKILKIIPIRSLQN